MDDTTSDGIYTSIARSPGFRNSPTSHLMMITAGSAAFRLAMAASVHAGLRWEVLGLVRIITADDDGLAAAAKIAEAMGQVMDAPFARDNAHRVLTLYFEDVARATSPRFDHIRMAEFTTGRMNAWASANSKHALVHIDQRFDSWLLGLSTLWAVRTFNHLHPDNLQAVNDLIVRVLRTKTHAHAHELVREDMMSVFLQYGDALQVAHEMSVAGVVFIACHELAHHELEHLGQARAQNLEFDADRRGYELMREVYDSNCDLVTLRRQPYVLAGGWIVLSLLDLWERDDRIAYPEFTNATPLTHPSASARLKRLEPLLASEQRPSLQAFLQAFSDEMLGIRVDLGLDENAR